MRKCDGCLLRYHCDSQTEFICKNNDYCKFILEQKPIDKNTQVDTPTGAEVICTLKHFMAANEGDEATECLIVSIGAELLNVSQDRMIELLCNE